MGMFCYMFCLKLCSSFLLRRTIFPRTPRRSPDLKFYLDFPKQWANCWGHPLDFLAGKSCSTKCLPTWDFFCYIENFCVSHLLKSAMVIVMLYFVLLFFYLSYKLGICQCICHTFCRSIWACFATCFSMLECCCTFSMPTALPGPDRLRFFDLACSGIVRACKG